MPVGILVVQFTNEDAVNVEAALVQTGAHPELQVKVERVVPHRAVGGGVHLSVRTIYPVAEGLLLGVAAGSSHGEVGEGGARPFDRMPIRAAALDAALQYAVADAGLR